MPEVKSGVAQVIDSGVTRKPLALIEGDGSAHVILSPENGARYRTVNVIELAAGSKTIDLQHQSECVYYIASGGGAILDLADGSSQPLIEGSMIHIGAKDGYRLEAAEGGMHAIGGCVPADPAFYDYLIESPDQ